MKHLHPLITVFLVVMFVAFGCGGGGGEGNGGGGNGAGDIVIDDQLVATWQLIAVYENNVILPLASTMGWQVGWTCQMLELKDNGQAIRKSYIGSTLAKTEAGTWTSQNQSGSWTFGTTTPLTYEVLWDGGEPWIANIQFSINGHNILARYVRVTNLTAHHPDLVRTWAAFTSSNPSQLKIDNVASSLSDYFGMQASSDTLTVQMLPDGTAILRELKNYEVVRRVVGTWASGGGSLQFTIDNPMFRGFFGAGGYDWTFNDTETGATVVIVWATWANQQDNHPPEFIGKWQATSATLNGNPVALADLFEWEPGVTSMVLEFWSDGTYEERNYKGSDLNECALGRWQVINSNQIQTSSVSLRISEYSFSGNSVSVTFTEGSDTVVLTLTKI